MCVNGLDWSINSSSITDEVDDGDGWNIVVIDMDNDDGGVCQNRSNIIYKGHAVDA